MRPSGRKLSDLRTVSIETNVMRHAEGSCLIKMGDTHVLCSATIEDKAPPFLNDAHDLDELAELSFGSRC